MTRKNISVAYEMDVYDGTSTDDDDDDDYSPRCTHVKRFCIGVTEGDTVEAAVLKASPLDKEVCMEHFVGVFKYTPTPTGALQVWYGNDVTVDTLEPKEVVMLAFRPKMRFWCQRMSDQQSMEKERILVPIKKRKHRSIKSIDVDEGECMETCPCTHNVTIKYDDGTSEDTQKDAEEITKMYEELGMMVPAHFKEQ
jgi:hypothetical protein